MVIQFIKTVKELLSRNNTTLLGALSCAFEWYDYALFGYLTTTLATLFFPNNDPKTALIFSFAVFASGFIMRPVGAIFFGYIGDHIGRKRALTLSLFAMAIPTVLLGALPTYTQIGGYAPILLIILRLLQGLAVGGNYGGSFILSIENAPNGQKALAGSLATFGTLGGLFFGSAVILILNMILNEQEVLSFGWRIPFALGGLSTFVAFAIRKYVPEDPPKKTTHQAAPIKEIMKNQKLDTLKAIGIILIDGVGIYLALVYMTTYATTFLHLPATSVLFVNTIAMGLLVLFIPFFGYLGDRFGAQKILLKVAYILLIVSLPLYLLLNAIPHILIFLFLQIVFAMLISAAYGTLPYTVVGIFPKSSRYTATGLAFNISVAAFGGTAPLVVTYLIQKTNWMWTPGAVLSIVGFIGYISIKTLHTNYLSKEKE